MRAALLYLLAAVFLAAIVSLAWWSRQAELPGTRVVRQGETVAELAEAAGVTPAELAEANGATLDSLELQPGTTIAVPVAAPTGLDAWLVHAAGIGAEALGVLLSFWLAVVAGLIPAGFRKQILGIALVLGLASYASTWATTDEVPRLVPRYVFGALKDGFAWTAAFPLFAAAFGFGRGQRQGAARREPAAAPAAARPTEGPAPGTEPDPNLDD